MITLLERTGKMKTKMVLVMIMMLGLAGCNHFQQTDEGLVLEPGTTQEIDDAAVMAEATGIWLASLASLLGVPILSLIGGGAIVGAKVWRTMKPKLEEASTEAEKYHDATEVLVANIETLKLNEPETWAAIEPYIASRQVGNVLAVIKALRGK